MSRKRAYSLQKSLVFLVTMSLFVMIVSAFAFAAKGDFATVFVAASPLSYDHTTGGGAFDDGTIGRDKDVVTSLESSDFKRFDIVTYFYKIEVNPATTDTKQAVEIDFEFTGNTTGQPGAAFIDIVGVQVNKGTIQDLIPGENDAEDAHHDPEEDTTASLTDEAFVGEPFTPKAMLKGTVRVDKLDAGDVIVVRIDVKLDYQLGAAPTGNLQASVSDMRLVEMNSSAVSPAQKISIGRQTVPFKITDIRFPGVSIVKTTRDMFGVYKDGALVETGAEVKWRYDVTNSGETILQNISIDDNMIAGTDNATFVGEITGDADAIFEPGEIWRYEATGTAIAGAYSNIGTVNAQDVGGSPVSANDPSSYTGVKPEIQITKAGDMISKVGDEIQYTIKVKNISTVDLPVSGTVTDSKLGLNWSFSNLAKDAEVTVPAAQSKYTVQTGDDEEEPTGWVDFTNTASVTVTFTGSTGFATDTETANWTTKLVHPKIELTKTANRDHTVVGDTVTYSVKIENIGDIDLYNVVVTDPMASSFSSDFPTTLDMGENASRTFTHTVAAGDVAEGEISNTATVHANPTTEIEEVTYTLTNDIHDDDTVDLTVYAPKFKVTKTLVAEPFKSSVYTLLVENLSPEGTPSLDFTLSDPKIGISSTFTLAAQTSKNDFTFAISGSTDQPYVTARFYLQGTSVYVDFGGEP